MYNSCITLLAPLFLHHLQYTQRTLVISPNHLSTRTNQQQHNKLFPTHTTMGNRSSSTSSTNMAEEKSFIDSEIASHQVVIFSKTTCGKTFVLHPPSGPPTTTPFHSHSPFTHRLLPTHQTTLFRRQPIAGRASS